MFGQYVPEGAWLGPLCKPGVAAIWSALQRAERNNGLEKDISCTCPLGGQDVTFTVQANPETAVPVLTHQGIDLGQPIAWL